MKGTVTWNEIAMAANQASNDISLVYTVSYCHNLELNVDCIPVPEALHIL